MEKQQTDHQDMLIFLLAAVGKPKKGFAIGRLDCKSAFAVPHSIIDRLGQTILYPNDLITMIKRHRPIISADVQ